MKNNLLSITIVSDHDSWINNYIPKFISSLEKIGHNINWVNDISKVGAGDICLLLGCSQIMKKTIMNKNNNNLVVHESDLPKGKGWSPMTWQILEGKNRIPISLFEIDEKIDGGVIYLKEKMLFNGYELIDEIRNTQAKYSFKLCKKFVLEYPKILKLSKPQKGASSYYKRRGKKDSILDSQKSIEEQFNLLRVVDNDNYPAYFEIKGHRYKIKIEKITK